MDITGIRTVVVYYLCGFVFSLVVHLAVGWPSKALMPKSMLVLILFMLAALPWCLLNLTNLFDSKRRSKNVYELSAHTVFQALILGLIFAADGAH